MAIFYWVNQSQWFQDIISDKLAILNARTTSWVLSLLGMHVQQTGTTVITSTLPVEIAESCTGSIVFLIFAAAVLPFPSSWKSRLKGLVLGLLALLFINLFRTCLIILVVSSFPGSLWTWHIVIGQIIVITGMIGVFLWWAKNNQQHVQFRLLRTNKTIFRALCLFTIGYLSGYQLYQIFLESAFGFFVKKLIETHTFWILSSLNSLFFRTQVSPFTAYPFKLIEGCLSSPMVVFFVAVVFAWPTRWWKRLVIILIGFVPFFYLYHLLRALLIAVTLCIQPKEVNFAYNFYGQIMLSTAGFAWAAYFWCSIKKVISYKRYSALFLTWALIAAVTGAGVGWLARHILVPFLTERMAGSTALSWDPEQAVSLTIDLQIFIWVSLMGSTPGLIKIKKASFSLIGIAIALVFFTIGVAAIETFQLAPHKGMCKLFVILMPFAVYYFYFLYPRIKPVSKPS